MISQSLSIRLESKGPRNTALNVVGKLQFSGFFKIYF